MLELGVFVMVCIERQMLVGRGGMYGVNGRVCKNKWGVVGLRREQTRTERPDDFGVLCHCFSCQSEQI